MWDIQLFKLNFDNRESQAVSEVIASNWLSMGDRIANFESGFGTFLGDGAFCSAVSNGTAALHIALMALDVSRGRKGFPFAGSSGHTALFALFLVHTWRCIDWHYRLCCGSIIGLSLRVQEMRTGASGGRRRSPDRH